MSPVLGTPIIQKLVPIVLLLTGSNYALPSYGAEETVHNGDVMKTTHNPNKHAKRAVVDTFATHGPPHAWLGLGDSYTAGPGAGGSWDGLPEEGCYNNNGSYAPQLYADFLYEGGSTLQFIPCTGATTQDILDKQINQITNNPAPDFAVLTMGGNDIGFANMIKSCLLRPAGPLSGDCDETIEEAKKTISDPAFKDRTWKVYDQIFEKMPNDYHYQVYHIGYSNFFNYETDWCNEQSMGLIPGFRPKLTKELRGKLAKVAADLNEKIRQTASEYVDSKQPPNQPPAPGWSRNRLFTIDPDYLGNDAKGLFGGHRFCEPGVEDETFDDRSIWFFSWGASDVKMVSRSHFADTDANACKNDPRYDHDLTFSFHCDYARFFDTLESEDWWDLRVVAPEYITRTFHPRTIGHEAVKTRLVQALTQYRPHERFDASCKAPASGDPSERTFIPGAKDLSHGAPEVCLPPRQPSST